MGIMDNSDEHFMKQAFNEAEKAFEMGEVPVGAVITCSGRIIARAHNLTEKLTDFTAHAEMQAYTSASEYLGNKYLDECTLYVTLEPCLMCAGAAYWTRVGKIVFGAYDEKRGYLKYDAAPLHPKTEVVGGIMEAECGELISRFFKEMRR